MVRYALADTRRKLTDEQFGDVLNLALSSADRSLLDAIESEPHFAEDDFDLAMDVNFRAILSFGSPRDLRFFSAIAGIQALAFRAVAEIAPDVMGREVAECAWAWTWRWRDDLSEEAARLERKLN